MRYGCKNIDNKLRKKQQPKKEKQKSKEFYNQILNVENANQDLVKEAKKRLNRDLSD